MLILGAEYNGALIDLQVAEKKDNSSEGFSGAGVVVNSTGSSNARPCRIGSLRPVSQGPSRGVARNAEAHPVCRLAVANTSFDGPCPAPFLRPDSGYPVQCSGTSRRRLPLRDLVHIARIILEPHGIPY